jgi:hypothetical protein
MNEETMIESIFLLSVYLGSREVRIDCSDCDESRSRKVVSGYSLAVYIYGIFRFVS